MLRKVIVVTCILMVTSCTCNLDKPVIEELTSFYRNSASCKSVDLVKEDITKYVSDLDGCDEFDAEKIALIPEVPPGVWSTKSLMCFSVSKKLTDKYPIGSPKEWKCENHTDMHELVSFCQKI